jgi:annexin A7/11
MQRIDTTADVDILRKAMKGMGCDERALIRVFANHKYQNPWAFQQLRHDYNTRFSRDLEKDVKDETRGDFEAALVALIRGPLMHDVYTLDKALAGAGTDEEALMDVLLCRSNADIRAIAAEYRHIKGRDLLVAIKDDVDDTLFRLYTMVLSATKAEDAAPVIPADIDHKVAELERATEGMAGANAIVVAQIFTHANAAQLRAISAAYHQRYHRSLEDVIEKEFRGDLEDVLLRMLTSATGDGGKADAHALRAPLLKTLQKEDIFTYRALRLYWGDRARLYAAQAAHQKYYHRALGKELRELLSGDYENLMVALIAEN